MAEPPLTPAGYTPTEVEEYRLALLVAAQVVLANPSNRVSVADLDNAAIDLARCWE